MVQSTQSRPRATGAVTVRDLERGRFGGSVTARFRTWSGRLLASALAALVLAVGLGGAPVSARYMTGLALVDWCKDDGSTFCPGYIAALVDYQSVLQVLDTETPRFCLPSNVKLAELRGVVLDQLGAQPPDALRGVAANLMVPALAQRFPA